MAKLEINQFNLKSGILTKYKDIMFNNTHWHKIIVENADGVERCVVLKTIMKFCNPLHFIPVCVRRTKNTLTFLMKNCGSCLERMCNKNLTIQNPVKKEKPFKISIELCFASTKELKFNTQDNVKSVLNKRCRKSGVLNLDNFDKEGELKEYCPLSQPKLLLYIMHLAKDIEFNSLSLQKNDIENLKPIEVLAGTKMVALIDLRHNNIKSISELSSLKALNITELNLDGNPVCDNFNEYDYVKAITEQIPTIKRLDNVDIKYNRCIPLLRNFVCSENGFQLVDQFLVHYFPLYDSKDRSVLNGLYHREALFSLTYLPSESTSSGAKVYRNISRNDRPLKVKNKYLFFGPSQILKILTGLPPTEHDSLSFTVDLVMYTAKCAVIVVTGVFRELSDSLFEADRLFSFMRTFVLLAGRDGEYSITNEMVHITNPTTEQINKAFKQVKVPNSECVYIPKPRNDTEMNEMARTLKAVTGLNMKWSQTCLEECKYDLKQALISFVDLFKKSKIPSSAFDIYPVQNIDIEASTSPATSKKIENKRRLINIQIGSTNVVMSKEEAITFGFIKVTN